MASDTASHFGMPLQEPAPGASDRHDRARSVSAELEAIFGEPKPAETAPRAGTVGRPPRRDAGSAPRRLSAATIGGLTAAALAGIAAGSLLVKAPPFTARASTIAVSKAQIIPGRTLARPTALPVEMATPAPTPQVSDPVLAEPARPLQPAPLPRARLHSRVRHAASDAEVRAADRRLRAAYAAAIRAGASHDLLVDDRDRWASARRREAHEPARLIASYDAIAVDLNRTATHRHVRPPRRSFLHTRFASWWR